MQKRCRLAAVVGLAALIAGAVTTPTTAGARHPDDPDGGPREAFEGEGVAEVAQHLRGVGHLPPRQDNVTVVGKGEVSHPGGTGGRVADVWSHGDYAYLNAFREPDCSAGGVHVMDISDLTNPTELEDAFIPTSAGSYAGEGTQVVPMHNEYFQGDLLVHQNETCDAGAVPEPHLRGGASLWDVSDPTNPGPLSQHVGDVSEDEGSVAPAPNDAHSSHVWTNAATNRTYMVLVDNVETTDVDIMDITDPSNPVMVNDQLDLDELFAVSQDEPDTLRSVFSHDFYVKRVGSRYVMAVAYWDGGYVLLDVTDPTEGNVDYIADSDFALLDEERLERGHEIAPEGNAHYMEASPDDQFLLASDEDFGPFRGSALIDSGPHAGTAYSASGASDTPPITEDVTLEGATTFVGLACEPLEPGEGTALIERGDCPFQDKLDNISDAGYGGGIVFNSAAEDCDALLSMVAEGDIPFVFVDRQTGLQLLGLEIKDDPCAQASPEPGAPSEATTIRGEFSGWGYVRLFEQDLGHSIIPGKPDNDKVPCIPQAFECSQGSLSQVDTYAIEEAQDVDYAEGYGDLSVHKAIVDPDQPGLAYIAYYSGGLRVVEYGEDGMEEVGAFIDEGGNNFWGANAHRKGGETYILASDRDFGLYVMQYTP